MKGTGVMGPAMERISHYFTPFQAHVVNQAEHDTSRFPMEQALLVLEREAKFKSEGPSLPALFVFQFEALSRNRLGYTKGLAGMAADPFYTEDWKDYILTLRTRLGDVDFADLIFVRSEQFVRERRRLNPDFVPKFPVLFGEKEGKIARANRGRDPDVPLRGPPAPARIPRGPPPPPPRRARGPRAAPRAEDRPARKSPQDRRERYAAGRRPLPGPGQARRHGRRAEGMGEGE